MISRKIIYPIDHGGDCKRNVDHRSTAFQIYQNLLTYYKSKDLFLLESLGPNTVDSRVSMIGINPVITITVSDCEVIFKANPELIEVIQEIYGSKQFFLKASGCIYYQISNRRAIWDFLRQIDLYCSGIEDSFMAFITMAYNTIHFAEELPGYEVGSTPDIYICCYSNYIEFSEHQIQVYQYDYPGAASIDRATIEKYLRTPTMAEVASEHSLSNFTAHYETVILPFLTALRGRVS